MESPLRKDDLKLIETLRWDGEHFVRGNRHLERAGMTAAMLGFDWHEDHVREVMMGVVGTKPVRLRIASDHDGNLEVSVEEIVEASPPWRIAIADERIDADDPWRRVKTTKREVYDRARASLPEGVDELLFLNERDEIAEGTITNLFVERDEVLLTPPVSSGALPGCLRAELLETGRAREAVLSLRDLEGAKFWIGNSLRGLIRAEMADLDG